jgi:hypothetical protein
VSTMSSWSRVIERVIKDEVREDNKNHRFLKFFGGIGVLNSGHHTCTVDTLPLEPCLWSIFLWLFWWWVSCELFAQAGLKL